MNPEELLSLTEDALVVFGPDAALVAVSPACRSVLQPLEPFLVTGTPWSLLLSEAVRQNVIPQDGAHQLSVIEERLNDPGAPLSEVEIETAKGQLRCALRATSDGGFALRIAHDAAGEDAQERDLEQIMSKVLEACPTCLTMARIGDGHILYRSPEATMLLGKSFNSRKHFVHREERADFITALLPNARVDDMRFTARRADESEFQALISARLIDYRGDDVVVSSITDLTDELAMRTELDRQRKQVFQSEKMSALGEVLAGVAHELNNPLSIVVGNAQLLAEDGIEGPARKRVEKLSEAAERCVSIVRAFLSMARDRPLDVEAIPARLLLETARDAFEAPADTGLLVDVAVPEDLPAVLVDEVQIVQVLTNLMINAEQALRDQPGARIELAAERADGAGQVALSVSDNGPGIPADIAPRIFDPLFTTKAAGKGTGLGLALCHRIAVAHGGSIELASNTSQGATFKITLPAEK